MRFHDRLKRLESSGRVRGSSCQHCQDRHRHVILARRATIDRSDNGQRKLVFCNTSTGECGNLVPCAFCGSPPSVTDVLEIVVETREDLLWLASGRTS
jgi:hypothetical protein